MQKAPTQELEFAPKQVESMASALNTLLADVFALFLKTKNFHWHMSGTHFRDYHLLLDEHASQLYAITDEIAERVRKLGATTLRSIGHIARLQRIQDSNAEHVSPEAMLNEVPGDELRLLTGLRETHTICDDAGDVASTSLIEVWIDPEERRHWFLAQTLGK